VGDDVSCNCRKKRERKKAPKSARKSTTRVVYTQRGVHRRSRGANEQVDQKVRRIGEQ